MSSITYLIYIVTIIMVIRTATTMEIARKNKAHYFDNLRKVDVRILTTSNVPTGPDSLRMLSHILGVTGSRPRS